MSIGHAPGEPQYTPDMRKDEDQITEADKADAKRRIQGQVAEEGESPDDSGSAGEELGAVDGSGVPPVGVSMH